mmetsp:Transcript_8463/g.34830  ORF Transcript_8463/g.34830 Transcript_8463/m.34830 type:complete len:241 (-) Transcript_8463:1758-2480(-)
MPYSTSILSPERGAYANSSAVRTSWTWADAASRSNDSSHCGFPETSCWKFCGRTPLSESGSRWSRPKRTCTVSGDAVLGNHSLLSTVNWWKLDSSGRSSYSMKGVAVSIVAKARKMTHAPTMPPSTKKRFVMMKSAYVVLKNLGRPCSGCSPCSSSSSSSFLSAAASRCSASSTTGSSSSSAASSSAPGGAPTGVASSASSVGGGAVVVAVRSALSVLNLAVSLATHGAHQYWRCMRYLS